MGCSCFDKGSLNILLSTADVVYGGIRPPLKQGQHGLIAPNESTLFPSQNVNIC